MCYIFFQIQVFEKILLYFNAKEVRYLFIKKVAISDVEKPTKYKKHIMPDLNCFL